MCDPNGEHRPPADNLERRPPADNLERRPPAGNLERRRPAGNLERRRPAGNLERRPLAGNLERRPLAGSLERRRPAGNLERRPLAGTEPHADSGASPQSPIGNPQSEIPTSPPPPPPHDLLDPHEPFDAGQWALHGLLSAYYESQHRGPLHGIDRVLERVRAAAAGASPERRMPEVVYPSPSREQGAVPSPPREQGAFPSPARQQGVPSGTGVPAGESRHLRAPSLALRPLFNYRRWALGGGLAAAAVIAVVLYIALTGAPRPAFAAELLRPPTPPAGLGADCRSATCSAELLKALISGDAAALSERAAVIDAARTELEARKAAVVEYCASHPASDDPKKFSPPLTDVFHAWTRVFRPLRDLGRFDEAVAEIDAALAYARGDNNPAGAAAPYWVPATNWVPVLLNDLGDMYALSGDHVAARAAYQESITARQQNIDAGTAAQPQRWQAGYRVAFTAGSMCELYWRLSYLAALEGDLRLARQEHARAEAGLRDYFVGVCRVTDTPLPESAGLLDAFYAVPLAFRLTQEAGGSDAQVALGGLTHAQVCDRYEGYEPSPQLTNYVRTHLYCEARLLRMAGDFVGAQRALRAAARVVYHPIHDYLRLDFYEPLEAGRVALALRQYADALEELNVAERHTGPIDYFCPDLNRPPIGPLPQAELKLLRGLALLGLHRNAADRAQARVLIDEALAVPRRMAATMSPAAGAAFLKEFQTWDELARVAR